jgi:plastocyanin
MFSKRTLSLAAAIAVAAVAAAAAPASVSGHASLVIRHQVRGCHAWSVDGGAFRATQSVTIRRGGAITVTNNDMMAHTLIETRGPGAHMSNPSMAHMGATTKVVFSTAGVYRFTTKAGEDYMSGMKTIGDDNVLRLTVTVR